MVQKNNGLLTRLASVFFWCVFPLSALADDDSIWSVQCRVPELNAHLEFRVLEDDVLKSINFGKERSMLGGITSTLMVMGGSTSLTIHQLSVHESDSGIYRMEWWNHSNPQLLNSYWISDGWSGDGEVRTTLVKMNCKADKSPSITTDRLFVFGGKRNNVNPEIRSLDGSQIVFPRTESN